ncbi:MAG: type II toxin-antitoxin system RelE/ParE family toxin [Lachnospiraceae bacterium]|nr:type II toxin-antitoxin system RelE/ParE family toxin [Lachnospiraceae bacterium]
MKGKRGEYYRIKLGGYRVIYTVINGTIVVISTLLAGSRGDVYKKMSGMK